MGLFLDICMGVFIVTITAGVILYGVVLGGWR